MKQVKRIPWVQNAQVVEQQLQRNGMWIRRDGLCPR